MRSIDSGSIFLNASWERLMRLLLTISNIAILYPTSWNKQWWTIKLISENSSFKSKIFCLYIQQSNQRGRRTKCCFALSETFFPVKNGGTLIHGVPLQVIRPSFWFWVDVHLHRFQMTFWYALKLQLMLKYIFTENYSQMNSKWNSELACNCKYIVLSWLRE